MRNKLFLLFSLFFFLFAADLKKAKELVKEGKYKEAIGIYLKDRKEKKDERLHAPELFRLYVNTKNRRSARKELKKIPINEWEDLAKYCEEKGEFNLAQEIYGEITKAGLKLAKGVEEIYLQEARVLLKKNRFKEAREKIREIPEKTEEKLYYLAKFFFLAEEFDSCLEYTRQFSKKFPKSDFRNTLYELNLLASFSDDLKPLIKIYRLLEIGENKEAEEELKKYSSPFAQILLAEVYEKNKKTDLAIKLLEGVITYDTTTFFASKAFLQLARIYQRINDEKRAMTILEELITRYPSSPFAPIARSLLKPEKRGGVH